MADAFDWTRLTDDPNDGAAQARVLAELDRIRRVHLDCDLAGFVEREARGRRMLDVGMVSHAESYVAEDKWRHRRFARAASYCLGIDILEPLVAKLAAAGWNVRTVDATSDLDLGERFELIFAGDVIEHVDDPVRLLRFCGRHLAPGGRLLVATPNPFSRNFVRKFKKDRTALVNLDHLAWYTPTNAMEVARRAGGLALAHVHLIKPVGFRELEQLLVKLGP